MRASDLRFVAAWAMPLATGAAALVSPLAAWLWSLGVLSGIALLEWAWPRLARSAPPLDGRHAHGGWFRAVLWVYALIQAALLALGVGLSVRHDSGLAAAMLGVAIGMSTGSQGITFAHELGHSRSRADRALGWALMASVLYAHFMVEHYRGHHVRAATHDDPASARRGESLWRFLPRTLVGSWRSAWQLEARRLQQRRRGWMQSPLMWATALQALWLVALTAAFGTVALLFWLVQAAHAVWLLETINYIEHYGLARRVVDGRPEPFGVEHAWNADHLISNSLTANLQRHADHHMHAWKPYASLVSRDDAPQLPTGYAGCIWLAMWPSAWFAAMEPRLRRALP